MRNVQEGSKASRSDAKFHWILEEVGGTNSNSKAYTSVLRPSSKGEEKRNKLSL